MVASSLDVESECSITSKQEVNSESYIGFHNGQMFADGLSFSGHERNKLWVKDGADFVDVSDLSGADSPNDSRSAIAADFDDDGDLDLFVHSIQRERHALYRNDATQPGSADAGFLKLRLRATSGHWEAIGATVIVMGPMGPTAQVLSRGAGFATCQAPELVFGLGSKTKASVEVLWPGGERESFGNLAAGSRLVLEEGTGSGQPFATHARPLPDPLPPGLRVRLGETLRDLHVVDSKGRGFDLDLVDLAGGQELYINFWASYCAPCVAEIPDLQKLHGGSQARVLGISVDVPASAGLAHDLMVERGGSYPEFYVAPEIEEGSEVPGVESLVDLERLPIPTTLVLSAEGELVRIIRGPIEAD